MIHYIERSQLLEEIMKCSKLALVEFVLPANELCEKQHHILNEIEKEFGETIEVFKIDFDESQEMKMRYHLSSMPTLLFFQKGKEIERKIGFMERQELIELIEELM